MKYFDLTLEDKKGSKNIQQVCQKLGIIQAIMENRNIILFDESQEVLDNTSSK